MRYRAITDLLLPIQLAEVKLVCLHSGGAPRVAAAATVGIESFSRWSLPPLLHLPSG